MPAEKATAIVLRFVEFSESSGVVTLFTREFGKVSALAKGARRPKGPFESALDLLALCRIVFLRKSSDALDLLTEAKLERRFRPAGRDLASLYAGYYVAELLAQMTDEYDAHPELFDAADNTLEELSHGGPVAALILRFELTALEMLGHSPSLELCVECGANVGSAAGESQSGTGRRVAFGQLAGGVLCESCRVGRRQVVSISAGVWEALKIFANQQSGQWRNYSMPSSVHGELRAVMNHYLSHLLGHNLRLHEFLGTICN